jgi:hypothetical protein
LRPQALNGVVSKYFTPLGPSGAQNKTLVNSSFFSYLLLNGGSWLADVPLVLAPSLVLVLNDVDISPSANFAPFRGMIEINSTDYAGVVSPSGPTGARFSCPNASVSPAAVWAVDSSNTVVEGLSIYGCGRGEGGAVHLQGSPGAWGHTCSGATIFNNRIWNASRAIWLETISGVTIDSNEVFNNSGHAIDFDAFSHQSVATNNNIYGNFGREGVFIEQAAVGITIANNSIGPGNGNGVAVFNNDMNTTTGPHCIVANKIFGNLNAGISMGSTAPRAGTPDVGVLIAGNLVYENGPQGRRQGYHTNGAQIGTRYACNRNSDGVSLFTQSAEFKVREGGGGLFPPHAPSLFHPSHP